MERERLLQSVRARLGRTQDGGAPAPPRFRPMAPPFADSEDDCVRLFLERQAELGVAVSAVAVRDEAQTAVQQLLGDRRQRITCSPELCWPAIVPMWTESVPDSDFGLCEADWAIAETGSIVLSMGGLRRRDVSLLPPAVGFFVARSRIVARLGDVLRSLAASLDSLPTCVTLVTGPSASADIVGVRTLGVHGPGEVHVWLVENE